MEPPCVVEVPVSPPVVVKSNTARQKHLSTPETQPTPEKRSHKHVPVVKLAKQSLSAVIQSLGHRKKKPALHYLPVASSVVAYSQSESSDSEADAILVVKR